MVKLGKTNVRVESAIRMARAGRAAVQGNCERPTAGKPFAEALAPYAARYGRDPLNNFAAACLNDNSIAELEAALARDDAEAVDIREWGLTGEREWRDALTAALEVIRDRELERC